MKKNAYLRPSTSFVVGHHKMKEEIYVDEIEPAASSTLKEERKILRI